MNEEEFKIRTEHKVMLGTAGTRLLSWYEHNYPEHEFIGVHDRNYRGTDLEHYLIAIKEKTWLGRTKMNEIARIKKGSMDDDSYMDIDVCDPDFKDHSRTLVEIAFEADDRIMSSVEKLMKDGGFKSSVSFYFQHIGNYKPELRGPVFRDGEPYEGNFPRVFPFEYKGEHYLVFSPAVGKPNTVLGKMAGKASVSGFIKHNVLRMLGIRRGPARDIVEYGCLKGPGRKGERAYLERISPQLKKEVRENIPE
ncbi:hypothetical protein GF371_04920 [Candidatus Woesearchaeota archaeon]|nr:hypothetical protein [Candidatus Woesearchaeota archaeon]